MIEPGARYRHYKGDTYVIVAVAHDATDAREGTEMIVYQSVKDKAIYCRDIKEFMAEVVWPDGVTRPRFNPQ